MAYTSDFDTLASGSTYVESTPRIAIGLDQVHREFSADALNAGVYFGNDHEMLTAEFVAALATKPFMILSGLSGSGKTLLATTFGEWLGYDQVLLQPVRPDWTSPEAILGYEDRTSESSNSQHAWSVPRSLSFILTAMRNPTKPYVLVLDEMNLAHVEQYFADVLSGMESNQPMVPNLTRDAQGWRMPPRDAEYLPWPKNLFVIGTINTDETTYAFSHKVLDRASVIEFRVTPDTLRLDFAKTPGVQHCDTRISRAFLERAQGDELNWPGRKAVGAAMQDIHLLLFQHGLEFGHRVVRESLRFSSMMYEIGINDVPTILDHIATQRILPKLERGIKPEALAELATLAAFGPSNAATVNPLTDDVPNAVLPKTLSKLRRL
jgi:5-methylcytosine-specific restriction protein B